MERNLLIELLEDGEKVSLYSPHFEGEEYSEFEKFLLTYKDTYPDDVRQLVYRLDIIKRDGARDRLPGDRYLADTFATGEAYLYNIRGRPRTNIRLSLQECKESLCVLIPK